MIEFLSKKECPINLPRDDANELFRMACRKVDIQLVKYSIAAGAINGVIEDSIPVNVRDDNGNTLLYKAVIQRNYSLIKLLIDCGFDTNIKNNDQNTHLNIAINNIDFNMMMFLINYGADLNSVNYYRHSCTHEIVLLMRIAKNSDKPYLVVMSKLDQFIIGYSFDHDASLMSMDEISEITANKSCNKLTKSLQSVDLIPSNGKPLFINNHDINAFDFPEVFELITSKDFRSASSDSVPALLSFLVNFKLNQGVVTE
ncbi:MAG: ankyrin repeat domain-containing protein [Endozoicomonadaceae bacterium]|nr:ankyrin repeat domain-containing protein [Endozoicomonadaceae bacterium]